MRISREQLDLKKHRAWHPELKIMSHDIVYHQDGEEATWFALYSDENGDQKTFDATEGIIMVRHDVTLTNNSVVSVYLGDVVQATINATSLDTPATRRVKIQRITGQNFYHKAVATLDDDFDTLIGTVDVFLGRLCLIMPDRSEKFFFASDPDHSGELMCFYKKVEVLGNQWQEPELAKSARAFQIIAQKNL